MPDTPEESVDDQPQEDAEQQREEAAERRRKAAEIEHPERSDEEQEKLEKEYEAQLEEEEPEQVRREAEAADADLAGELRPGASAIDFRRLRRGEAIAAASAILLFLCMLLKWFSVTVTQPGDRKSVV